MLSHVTFALATVLVYEKTSEDSKKKRKGKTELEKGKVYSIANLYQKKKCAS